MPSNHPVVGRPHTALLIIDMINNLEFDGAERLLRQALPVAESIVGLKARAKAAGMPVIYVNDNFGKWKADFREVVRYCLENDVPGRPLARLLAPDEDDDLFVLKPKHSGFYGTTLEILLRHLEVDTLILTGVAGDICVLFTANDAYMRDFDLYVPQDGIASLDRASNDYTLNYMERVLKVDTRPARDL